MNDALYIAATGMQAQQLNVDTIANNLANMNTAGFKVGRVSFQDLVYRSEGHANSTEVSKAPGMLERGSGVGVAFLSKLFTPGDLKRTDAPLDLAIQGNGFLEVTLGDGSHAFTRGGSLLVNKDGWLTSADGNLLKPGIQVGNDAAQIMIEPSGRVMARSGRQEKLVEVGNIELANFGDSSGLSALGMNLYKPSERSGDPVYGKPGEDGFGNLAQGMQEGSNVNMVDQMVSLMAAQRAYEMSVKVIQAADQMLEMSNNLRR